MLTIKNVEDFKISVNPDKEGFLERFTKNDKTSFFFVDMDETTDQIGGQIKRQTKLIFANEHTVPHRKVLAALKASKAVVADKDGELTSDTAVEISVKAKGAFYDVSVAPHYIKQADGTYLTVSMGANKGSRAIGTSVSFFCFEGENPAKLMTRLTKGLEYIVEELELTSGEQLPETEPAATTGRRK